MHLAGRNHMTNVLFREPDNQHRLELGDEQTGITARDTAVRETGWNWPEGQGWSGFA